MRPFILPPTIATTMVFLITKILKCLQVVEDVEIGLSRADIIPLAIADFIIVMIMVYIYLGLKKPDTITLAIVEFIILVLTVELELGLNIPATLPLVIMEQELMLTGEVDIGLIPATLPPITQFALVDC